ncbi:amidohydrolase [Aliidiomarina haloalkalitolerans]|uniref:Amidohydrolase n=1 Tax=Aliidiomarina haloalkalitolerans TaxID=859059 RepID=A0A432VR11_9GAMM|nr:amidohydrolase [Aliidiomarina haloalkalitolerans]RUO18685.1 amidohydrolase [Aliidiomarina haloalkalitolerans]
MKLSLLALSLCAASAAFTLPTFAAGSTEPARIDTNLEQRVIEWRRDIHQHPELSNREFRTAALVAEHLEALGMEVHTGIAHTGVVGILRGAKPGPTVALRADMDALPVREQTGLPFASTVTAEFNGAEVPVMHACGHDMHVAMLMGAAEYLAQNRDDISGSVMFIFQPAEEGAPAGEEGGAQLMIKEGIFERFERPDAIFGIHVGSMSHTGHVGYRSGPIMASSDRFNVRVRGEQTHGSRPWGGVDPIVAAAAIVTNSQSIVSRKLDLTKAPAVLSFGVIQGGVRNNIIPDEVYLEGTMRNFDMDTRAQMFEKFTRVAESTAAAHGATAEVVINEGYRVTINSPDLMERMLPTTRAVVGDAYLTEASLGTASEDFSFFALEVPGKYVFLGATPYGQDPATAPGNHSPFFNPDEAAMKVGTELFINWTLNFSAE